MAPSEKKRRPSQETPLSPTQLRNAAILLGPVLVVNVALATQRAKVWKDDRSLFEAALEVAPGSARVQHNYGSALLLAGESLLSIPYFERASAILPSWSEPQAQLGVAWLDEQQPREAELHLRKAVALEPDAAKSVFNLAAFLLQEGKLAEAKSLLTPFVQKFPARAREASLLRQVEAKMHAEQLP
jgi:Tfp pilus assembly protein PilF